MKQQDSRVANTAQTPESLMLQQMSIVDIVKNKPAQISGIIGTTAIVTIMLYILGGYIFGGTSTSGSEYDLASTYDRMQELIKHNLIDKDGKAVSDNNTLKTIIKVLKINSYMDKPDVAEIKKARESLDKEIKEADNTEKLIAKIKSIYTPDMTKISAISAEAMSTKLAENVTKLKTVMSGLGISEGDMYKAQKTLMQIK